MMPAIVLGLALAPAAGECYAVASCRRRLEFVFKPGTLVAVLIAAGLLSLAARDVRMAWMFVVGFAFSLARDVLLLLPGDRFFLAGLAGFWQGCSEAATLFRPDWSAMGRTLIISGGSLFFASDCKLAWNLFVAPSASGRLRVKVAYHLAQMALAASIALAR